MRDGMSRAFPMFWYYIHITTKELGNVNLLAVRQQQGV